MNKTQILLIFTIALILGLISGFLNLPIWFAMIALCMIVLPMSLYPTLNSLYFTKDINYVEKFLVERRKQPIYRFYYALANDNKADLEEALEILKKKYKNNPHWLAVFEIAYALHVNHLLSVKEKIGDIKQKDIRDYYEALVSVEQGDFEGAMKTENLMKKVWMKESILASIAMKKGLKEEANTHKQSAIEHAKGIQRYILVKEQENKK
ncbi:hypothetical protein [Bacillus suaedaesalsae]|uniref:DUF2892 domain-containing protein n=1 Tax=Bacillus suaedaesalsae TaxID=2810349 RepID=A0ABS2DMH8_9BACI|nr:hypothetical protein [Bacillus suaedaesalsae]MBM6619715.1 hypothetical protein [Bacillus suaedaesalsae]